jgi:glycosyltransferase involved in cell wall biosynthesis
MVKAILLSPVPAPYQLKLATALQEYMDIEFWFLTSIKDSTRPAYWEKELPSYCKILPTYFRKAQLFLCPQLPKLLTEYDPDYIILHGKWNNMSWLLAYAWARRNHKKIMMGPLEIPTKQTWYKEKLRKILYQKIDAYLCVGYRSLDYYSTVKEKGKTWLFSYAADIEREMSHPLRNKGETVTFLHSGSINQRFRVLDILRVFERISSEHPNIRLILSGNGNLKPECLSFIQNSELCRKLVSWIEVNSWEEVSDVYRFADVLISFPIYAGWGLTIPEAMASGMGIISGNCVEAGRELILEGFNGFLVRDCDELERAMISYIIEPDLVRIQGERNKKIAPKEGIHEKAKTLFRIIESLAGNVL